MKLQQKTIFPSHLVRQLAHRRAASNLPFDVWVEQQWIRFSRANGYRSRNGTAQEHFDRYLELIHR